MAGSMRAIRFETGGHVKPVTLPEPEPGPEDVIVQVLASGVCHTDLHLLHAVKAGTREPMVPGHETMGRIARVGPDVYRVSKGDLVGVHYEQPCGRCRQCRRKRTNLCREGHSLGFDVQGGYAEFVKARQDTVLALPPNLEPEVAAPLSCSGTTAYHVVVTLGQAEEGSVVVILGAGGVGLSAIQVARAQQARVIAVDPREAACRAAKEAGAERAVRPEDTAEAVRGIAGEEGADIVADFVGTADTFERGRRLLGFGGRFVAVAPGEGTVPVSADDLMDGGRAYLGAYSSTMAEFARVIALAEAGLLRPVVTRRAPLGDAATVLDDLEKGRIVGRAVLLHG